MGVKGKRVKNNEPVVFTSVDHIISQATADGFVVDGLVDINKIVEKEDIKIIKDSTLPSVVSGYLKCIEGKWVIGVNASHHQKRQRFTIAHEYAHYIYHKDDHGDFIDEEIYFRSESTNNIEYKANQVASELLMPTTHFQDAINSGINTVEKLAEKFGVSAAAVKIRAVNLGYRSGNE
jgi:Zn-dependent peptidase ImmA (M78 family)